MPSNNHRGKEIRPHQGLSKVIAGSPTVHLIELAPEVDIDISGIYDLVRGSTVVVNMYGTDKVREIGGNGQVCLIIETVDTQGIIWATVPVGDARCLTRDTAQCMGGKDNEQEQQGEVPAHRKDLGGGIYIRALHSNMMELKDACERAGGVVVDEHTCKMGRNVVRQIDPFRYEVETPVGKFRVMASTVRLTDVGFYLPFNNCALEVTPKTVNIFCFAPVRKQDIITAFDETLRATIGGGE